MDVAAAQEFLRTNHHGVLATFRADGRPQLSPVLATVDAEGRVLVSTTERAAKVRNLRRDARVSLAVLNDGYFGEWTQVEGTAEIIPVPEALDVLVDYYRRATGEHPDWDEYRAAMTRQRRVIIRFVIERGGPVVNG